MKAFPLFITVSDRPVVVFGGGEEAAAKLRLLLKTEAQVLAVAADFEPAVRDLVGVERIQADPLTFALPTQVPFVYAATGDESLDAQIAERVRSCNVLVCAADQPAVSDFSTPALVDRDPVVVAIGTEGTAPVLARSIKAQVEFILEPGLGLIARAAAGLRPLVARTLHPGKPRRAFWQSFFSAARTDGAATSQAVTDLGVALLQSQSQAEARDLTTIAPGSVAAPVGRLSVVGTGTGRVSDLTIGAHRAIDEADVVLADPLVSRAILELARREAVQTSLPLGETASILEHLAQGQSVVRLVAGSGAVAGDEIDALTQAGATPHLIQGLSTATDEAEDRLSTIRRPRPTPLSFFNRKAA